MKTDDTEQVIATIVDIFASHGDEEYLGEPVTMSEHMLQAAHFAAEAGAGEDAIIAALVHDIGHFTSEHGSFTMEDTNDKFHEDAGAQVLDGVFPEIVVEAVKHHVAAKRYLCAVDHDYRGGLSPASVHSLMLQGGPMSKAEQASFEENPHLDQILLVRRCDDKGKVPGLDVPPLDHYLPMMRRVLESCRPA
ncbi:MAG: HD domain-containing protein [Pseudomonadota bacterium]|nr:HD domain-containing protein [Pseudomonadota bacterium]MEC8673430.1 HD domain-containing protein [Pseudomonadota bacterium]